MNYIGVTINDKYTIEKFLGSSELTESYYAVDANQKKVVLKFLNSDMLSSRTEDIVRFKNDTDALKKSRVNGLVPTIDYGECEGRIYIVTEFAKGNKLYHYIEKESVFKLKDVFTIIHNISKIISFLHKKNIIFKDINSANIYFDKDSLSVLLNGYSLYHLKEYNVIKKQDNLSHMFSYVSPEILNGKQLRVDERSDLYSIGVLFYLLLTGVLPYQSDSVSDMIYQIMAKEAEPPSVYNSSVPEIVDRIVLKLIDKDSSKRYFSAEGLLCDLAKLIEDDYHFEPAEEDSTNKIKKRIDYIDNNNFENDIFSKIDMEHNVICFYGETGVGKSRLIEEIEVRAAQIKNLCYIGVKCFDNQNKIPYSVVRNIVRAYLKKFRLYSKEKKALLKGMMRDNLGKGDIILIRFVPDLSEIITDISLNGHIEKTENFQGENLNLISAVINCFKIILQYEKKIVLSIDDYHVIDEQSARLISSLVEKLNMGNVSLYLTINKSYIERDADQIKSFNNFIKKYYYINTFSDEQFDFFINKMLNNHLEKNENFQNYLKEKSRKNPLFATEILNQLISGYALKYENFQWLADIEKLNRIEIPATIIDILLQRLSSLNRDEKTFLSYIAVIGKPVSTSLLIQLDLFKNEKIVNLSDLCIKLQFLELENESGNLAFLHSKIKNHIYNSLDSSLLRIYHNNVAVAYERDNINSINDSIFDIIYHFKKAENYSKIKEYTFIAGIIAKENFSYEESKKYFELYKKSLTDEEINSQAGRELLYNMAELDMFSGKYSSAGESFLKLVELEDKVLRKAELCKDAAKCFFKTGEFKKSENYGIQALSLLGEKVPTKKVSIILSIVLETFLHFVQLLYPVRIVLYRKKNSESFKIKKYKKAMWIYEVMLWMYLLVDTGKFYRTLIRALNVAERKIGFSKELTLSLRSYASMSMSVGKFSRSMKYFYKSREIDQLLGNEVGIAQSLQLSGYCQQWKANYKSSILLFEKSESLYSKIGQYSENLMNAVGLYFNNYMLGYYEIAYEHLEKYKSFVALSDDNFGSSAVKIYDARIRIETGDMDSAEKLCREAYQIADSNNIEILRCTSLTELGKLFLIERNYSKAKKNLEAARDIFEQNNLLQPTSVYFYSYLAEAYIKEYREEKVTRLFSINEKKIILKNIETICRLSLKYSKKWVSYYPNALRVYALYYDLKGMNKKTDRFFRKAIREASKIGRKYEMGKTYYDYGVILLLRGRFDKASEKLESALRLFSSIGSQIYIKRTMVLLDYKQEKSSMQRFLDKERLDSVLKISQKISSILNPNELLNYVINKIVEIIAAHRGYIFISNNSEDDFGVKAKKSVTDYDDFIEPSSIARKSFSEGEVIISGNAIDDEEFKDDEYIKSYSVKSFITVPIKNHEKIIGACYLDNPLMSDVFTYEDSELLGAILTQTAIALENAYLYENLGKEVEQRTSELNTAYKKLNTAYGKLKDKDDIISKDLELARKVQTSMLPSNLSKLTFLEFSINYQPMSTIGGDIYDICEINDHYVRIFLADATGHGVQAALVTMILNTEYAKLKYESSPSELLFKFNNILIDNYSSVYVCFTGVVLDIDYKNKKILFSSAGHPDQILIDSKSVVKMNAAGRLLGVVPDSEYENKIYKIGDDTKLFLFTDGIYEQFNAKDEEFGETRLFEIVEQNSSLKCNSIANFVFDSLQSFTNKPLLSNSNDDITFIGLQVMDDV